MNECPNAVVRQCMRNLLFASMYAITIVINVFVSCSLDKQDIRTTTRSLVF